MQRVTRAHIHTQGKYVDPMQAHVETNQKGHSCPVGLNHSEPFCCEDNPNRCTNEKHDLSTELFNIWKEIHSYYGQYGILLQKNWKLLTYFFCYPAQVLHGNVYAASLTAWGKTQMLAFYSWQTTTYALQKHSIWSSHPRISFPKAQVCLYKWTFKLFNLYGG